MIMKNWTELENSSFFDANARERALGMVDKGTFTEFLDPLDRYCSPHLPVLGTAVEFDDGTVCGVGLIGQTPCVCGFHGRQVYRRRYRRGKRRENDRYYPLGFKSRSRYQS